VIDPLHELFTVSVTPNQDNSATTTNFNKDLEGAFASPTQATTSGMLSNDKIMALFKIPQLSAGPVSTGINLGTSPMGTSSQRNSSGCVFYEACSFYLVNSPGLIPPQGQQPHLLAHHKSASFGGNLYQQANHFPPRPPAPTQVRATNSKTADERSFCSHFSFNNPTPIQCSQACRQWPMPMLMR
jgi:hypothetical protein